MYYIMCIARCKMNLPFTRLLTHHEYQLKNNSIFRYRLCDENMDIVNERQFIVEDNIRVDTQHYSIESAIVLTNVLV